MSNIKLVVKQFHRGDQVGTFKISSNNTFQKSQYLLEVYTV